jgi:beta-barrel assembly-enhancing protease
MLGLNKTPRHPRAYRFISFAAAGLIFGVSGTTAQAISWRDLFLNGIQVIQLSNVSTQQEIALGEQIHKNLQAKGMRLSSSRALNTYVGRIGQRLANVASRTKIPYRFFVVQDDAVNAYATAGGYVYVTTGLMKAADNEAQLASVIAHEIAHIEEKHLIQQIRQQTITRGLVSTALGSDRNVLANIGVDLLVSRPQSRGDEFEADETGLKILRDGEYSAAEMPRFMQKLLGGTRTPTFLSTHPAVPDRITKLEELVRSGTQNSCSGDRNPVSCGVDENLYNREIRSIL